MVSCLGKHIFWSIELKLAWPSEFRLVGLRVGVRLTTRAQRLRSAARELRGWREERGRGRRTTPRSDETATNVNRSSRDARSSSLQRIVRRYAWKVGAWSLEAK